MALELNVGEKWLEVFFTGANPTFYMRCVIVHVLLGVTVANEHLMNTASVI